MFSRLLFSALFLSAQPSFAAVLSIGHRGDSLHAPENTVSSFRSALGKADIVETDVYPTSDGKLVIMHDSTVDRTTDGTGAISGKTLAQMKLLDAGSWFSTNFVGERVPTLEEMVTNVLPVAIPLIERKEGTPAAYVAELQRLNAVTNVIVQSFDWNFLGGVHALQPNIRLCALGSGTLTTASLASITNAGAEIVAWEKSGIGSNEVSLVHNAGLTLFVWTVDGAAIQNYINLGVDGIISNDPGRVKNLQQPLTNAPVYLGDGLVAYWKMDDGLTNVFETNVVDSIGTNLAELRRGDGASHWLSGSGAKFGGCVQVAGTNAYVNLPQTEALDIHTNELTISLWVKLAQLPSQSPSSFGPILDSTTDCYVVYLDKSNKELRFKVTDVNGHAARPGIPESMLVTNQWIHVVGVYSGNVTETSGEATIYMNGQVVDVHVGSDSSTPVGLIGNLKTGQVASIGREGPTGANYFFGSVDDLAIWRRALSAKEVQDLYAAPQNDLSVDDLLKAPTPLIQVSAVVNGTPGQWEIHFKNFGSWQNFGLSKAESMNSPFQPMNTSPVDLGGGNYKFVVPTENNIATFFRVFGK